MSKLEYPPEEPVIRGRCGWCGDELYAGEHAFQGNGGIIHDDCLLPMLEERLGAYRLAEHCGYREVIL